MRRELLALAWLTACGSTDDKRSDSDATPTTGTTADSADSGDASRPDPYDVTVGPYSATVRWTSYGVPHIVADEYGSLAYGMGFAFARDHICTLMDQVVMVRSERARYFGAGPGDLYLNQDFGWKGLRVVSDAESGWFELDAEVQSGLIGYSAGVNAYLEEVGVDGIPDERCAGADWVRPVSHIDLLSYYLALGLIGSGGVFVDAVGSAVPPSGSAATRYPPPPVERTLEVIQHSELGSNGWALGSERTESGGGMLLANPHFPAVGERKWHESHLTIPGELDVYGASLMGVPAINVGFNRHVAWTHTVSSAPRFTAVLLSLDPSNPTRYDLYGTMKEMEQDTVSVDVLRDGGSVETVSRTLYRTELGPVINAPVVGWTSALAVAIQDANADNLAMLRTWFDMNRADSLEAFQGAHRTHTGIPWVHTMAADSEGNAWYIDSAAVPNWSEEAQADYPDLLERDGIAYLFSTYGVYAVPSSDPRYAWVEEEGARVPGLVPYDKMPQLTRSDFIYNANDNHWLTNPSEPLTGYSLLYGAEDTPRSPRTRMNLRYLTEAGDDTEDGEDGRFSLDELEAAALGGRGIFAELLLDDILGRCNAARSTPVEVEGLAEPVDIGPACDAMAAWDRRASVDSTGAHVLREVLGSGVFDYGDLTDAGPLWAEGFDPARPLQTPAGLAPVPDEGADPIVEALARAVAHLDAAGVDPAARLGDIQTLPRGDTALPFPGGPDLEGVIQIATWSGGASGTLLETPDRPSTVNSTTDLVEGGYPVNYGNSFVMAVELTPDGPDARAIITYGQSEDEDSPHYVDQPAVYGSDGLRPVLFEEADILADPALEERVLTLE